MGCKIQEITNAKPSLLTVFCIYVLPLTEAVRPEWYYLAEATYML